MPFVGRPVHLLGSGVGVSVAGGMGVPVGVVIYLGGLALFDRKAITDVIDIGRSILARQATA